MTTTLRYTVLLSCTTLSVCVAADDTIQAHKHQVTGLFSPDREEDLRVTMERLPDIKLVSIDFKNAEAVFEYSAKKTFSNVKTEELVKRFDAMVRSVSNGTFGIKPLRSMPLEKLKLIEIDVVGLDCKGCSLGAYEAVYKLDGVERATASFRDGRVTALIDPQKTERTKLEEALKKKGVQLKTP